MPRILLVDDDLSVRTVLRLTLVHFGHSVTEASNGRDALQLFDRQDHELVLTDIMMPDQDGLEFLMELRKRKRRARIVAMSGGGRVSAADYLHTATLLGAERVLAKPFSNELLIATISELLAPGPTDATERSATA